MVRVTETFSSEGIPTVVYRYLLSGLVMVYYLQCVSALVCLNVFAPEFENLFAVYIHVLKECYVVLRLWLSW